MISTKISNLKVTLLITDIDIDSIRQLLHIFFQPIISQNSMKYTYIKAQFRTRYIFVCQISAAHVVIVLNTLLQKCVDNEHYLWISSQVQVMSLLKHLKNAKMFVGKLQKIPVFFCSRHPNHI